jgi:hypothetical protein
MPANMSDYDGSSTGNKPLGIALLLICAGLIGAFAAACN